MPKDKDFFSVTDIDNKLEQSLLAYIIASTDVGLALLPIVDYEHFESKYAKKIYGWVKDFYAAHNVAPGVTIKEILKVEAQKRKLKPEEKEKYEYILSEASEALEDEINEQYVITELKRYVEKKNIENRARQALALLEKNKVEEARKQILNIESKLSVVEEGSSLVFTKEAFDHAMSERNSNFITLPGALGQMLGPFERGWLVSFLAPMKQGKTFGLLDWGLHCFLRRKKVFFFSLEMKEKDIDNRIYSLMTGKTRKEGIYEVPVFDCLKNQMGTCKREDRIGRGQLRLADGFAVFNSRIKHKPCTVCRGLDDDYEVATWKRLVKKEAIDWSDMRPWCEKCARVNPKNFHRFCPTSDSVEVSYIYDKIKLYERLYGFVPDVIVVDYADRLKAANLKQDKRHQLDEIWQDLARLALEFNGLVLTASQTNRDGIETRLIKQTDVAEDVRKNAHVSVMVGMNLFNKHKEKARGILRYNTLYHRYNETPVEECMVLRCLALSQPCLDSMLVNFQGGNYSYISG